MPPMPMISPPVTPAGGSQSASQAGSRNRGTDEAQGQGFGAALERSRANGDNSQRTKPSDEVAGTETARKPARKPGADDDGKDALPADPNLAFLAPVNSPLHALTLAGRAAAQGAGTDGAADGAADGTAAVADIPLDAAATDPLAKPAPLDAAALAANAKATPAADADADAAAQDAAKNAAKPVPTATAPADAPADAAPTASLQDIVRAAVAAQTMGVGTTRPGATGTAATPAVGTAATGRAGPRAVSALSAVSANTAEQLASAAQPKAGADASNVTTAAVAAAVNPVGADSDTPAGSDAQATVTPLALQQGTATTASAARAEEAAAARPSVHTVAPEVGSDKWGPALGQQLARMSTTGHHTAELNLNPAGLGPLKVTLSLGDSQAQAMFVSAHESVRKAVEAALPQLRTALSEQGITLGQASVGADTRQASGQDAAFAQQQQQQQTAARQQTASYPGAGRTAASAPVAPLAASRPSPAAHASAGLDTFA